MRLSGKNKSLKENPNYPPILLYGGLNSGADIFISNYEEKSTAYFLVNRNYDIWIINNRGNIYSNKHEEFSYNDEQYWDFTWQEMGEYDFQAVIDFIEEKRKQEGKNQKISIVAYSQGSAVVLYGLSLNPKYQEKIGTLVFQGPTYTAYNNDSIMITLAQQLRLAYIAKFLGIKRFSDDYKILYYATKYLKTLALLVVKLSTDSDVSVIEQDKLHDFFANYPAGTSFQTYEHWFQLAKETNQFRKFDYRNQTKNFEKYGSFEPPAIDVGNVQNEAHLLVGQNDMLGDPQDAIELYNKLKQTSKNCTIQFFQGGHLFFNIAKNITFLHSTVSILDEFYIRNQ